MSVPVPSQLRYQSIPSSVKASTKTVGFSPSNGSSFVSNSNNLIRIEIRSTGYLSGTNSYLKFNLKNNSTNAVNLDGFCSSVFNRVRLTSASTVLSDVSYYGQLSNFLIQVQSSDDFQRIMQIIGGGDNSPDDLLVGGMSNQLTGIGGATPEKTYILPLVNGFLNSGKYIPLEMLAGPLTLELYLEPDFNTVFNSGDGAAFAGDKHYTVSTVQYVANIINIEDDSVSGMLRSMLMTSGLEISTDDYTTQINSIPANATSATLTIPDRSQVLSSIMTVFKHNAPSHIISGIQSYKHSTTEFQTRIGSSLYPVQPVSVGAHNLGEAFSELLKCFNSTLFSLNNHTFANVSTFGNDTNFDKFGCFAVCSDFEKFPEASGQIESGINTSALSLPVQLTLKLIAPATGLTAIHYCRKQVIYTIRGDGTIVKQE